MISYYTLSSILLLHWIFDFMLQTHEQAKSKSKCNGALCAHVGIYSFGLFLMACFNASLFGVYSDATIEKFFGWIFLNTIFHFLTDYVTSRASSLLWKDGNTHDFFVIIGFDQLIHALTLFGTLIWLTS